MAVLFFFIFPFFFIFGSDTTYWSAAPPCTRGAWQREEDTKGEVIGKGTEREVRKKRKAIEEDVRVTAKQISMCENRW